VTLHQRLEPIWIDGDAPLQIGGGPNKPVEICEQESIHGRPLKSAIAMI
jgi:hypothetical protein